MLRSLLAATAALFALHAAPVSAAVAIAPVGVSESFAEKLSDDFGVREQDVLAKDIERALARELARRGHVIADAGGEIEIKVTIEDAKPNRPTFEQLSERPGLDSIRSFGIGGARLTAVVTAPGAAPQTIEAEYYETNIDFVNRAADTWYDAGRAIRRLARDVARAVPPAQP